MPNLLKAAPVLLLFSIVIASGNSSGPLVAPNPKTASDSSVLQTRVEKDLSGKYEGWIYLKDITGSKFLMRGIATLEIKARGKEFTLTQIQRRNVVKELSGKISMEVIGENILAGTIEFAGDNQQITTRWKQGPRGSLKIVRRVSFPRVFRFCTHDFVNKGECNADL